MNLLKQAELSCSPAVLPKAALSRLVPLLFALGVAGCQLLPKTGAPAVKAEGSSPVSWYQQAACEKLLVENDALRHEIDRLQKQLAEKEAHIRNQEARHQDQVKTFQQSSSQAAHAQVKLRRLATRPAAASTIAEVEVLMRNLNLSPRTDPEAMLQTQAQRLLDAATAAYEKDNFGAAMDYAAQAREFLGMINSNRARKTPESLQTIVSFHAPLSLRAIKNSNLRQEPGLTAPVSGTVKKETTMTADAYRGEWLQVLTSDGRSGWIFNELVETQVAHPRRNATIME